MLSIAVAAQAAVLDLVAFVGGQVHTLEPGASAAPLAVVVEGDRIKSVCPLAEVPPNARRIDASGLHVVPGYIDALAYHDAEHERLYTLAGVTVICDHGNELARILGARAPAVRAASLGPEIVTAGVLLDGEPPATNAATVLEDVGDAREAVQHLLDYEVQFFATHANLAPEVWSALVAAARDKSRYVFGPRPRGASLESVLATGPRGLVALDSLLPAGKGWNEVSLDEFPALAQRVAESGVWVIPTLSALSKDLDAVDPRSSDLALLGPNYTNFWSHELELRRASSTPDTQKQRAAALAKSRALFAALRTAGAKLAPGSGAPHPWLLPGEGLHRELAQWAAAGVPAADCLAACTRDAAECFRLLEAGTIAPNKVANLVLLRADPRTDVAALRDIAGVVRRGAHLDGEQLESMRRELLAWAAEAQAEFDKPIQVDPPKLPEGKLLLSGHTETITAAGRAAAERWAVVREVDDTLTFCGQRVQPGRIGQPDIAIGVRQRVRKGRLDSFEVRASAQGRELVVKGVRAAEQWRVERRLDGQFIDLNAAREDLAAIDCDSVTSFMLLALTRKPGHFPVMRFHEGLELEVVRWDMAVNAEGDHGFRTPSGLKLCELDVSGAVKVVVEQVGAGQGQTSLLELELHGGPGLPLPPETVEKLRSAAAREASAGEKR